MDKHRQEKKEQFKESKNKGSGSKIIALIAVVAVAGIVGAFLVLQGPSAGNASVKSIAGEVRLDMNQISDGQAHYFKYATDKGTISFFVIRSVDGVMRAAFDACDVCYHEKKGYRQEGNMMVCNNCNMKFRSDLINDVKGGCNPAPLNRRIEGSQLVITEKDLLNGAWYFGG
jgi:uncharacterized membrane protein